MDPLEFRLFDFQTKDENGLFIIEIFGINEKGETVYIKINDFKPFFYILVDETWTSKTIEKFIKRNIEPTVKNACSLVKGELCEYNKLYWFSGDKKSKFLRLSFNNISTYYKTRNIWYDKKGKKLPVYYKTLILQIYETKIPPLLRYFHINQISPSGWIEIVNTKLKSKSADLSTTCTYEYTCSIANIIAKPEKETRVPYKIASFDIEASSSHGDFPLPVKTYKKLATQIVDIITKNIDKDVSFLKGLLKRIINTAFSFDILQNVDKIYTKRNVEKEQIAKLIDELLDNSISINNNAQKITKIENSLSNWISTNTLQNDTCVELDDNDDDNDAVIDDVIVDDVIDDNDEFQTKMEKPTVAKNYIIIDILKNKEETRENKIIKLNETLMSLFPEVKGDETTFIGTTFSHFGEKEPYFSNCLVLGTCDLITGIDIQTFKTEKDLLLAWTELIQDENPDIIIGYNIFGFDYEFLYQRACQNECEWEFLELSRKKNDVCAKFNGFGETCEIIGIENSKVVLATGEYDLRYIKMAGRIQIDMYAYLRRDFNLSSYKLDDVAGQFICDDIKKIEHNKTGGTILTTGNLTGIHIGDYIHIEIVSITTNYIHGGKKFHICDLTPTTIIIDEAIDEYYFNMKLKWGIAKDDVSPQDIFRLTNGTASDRAIVAKYCVQDCNLVHHLLNKIDVITGYVEMSNICSVPISFLVFRGQGIKLTSYVAKKCREKNTLIPDLDSSFGNDEGYEGAIVLPPKCSMYMDNPVACVDYASLYPSSMISNNLSPDSKVWTQEYNLDGELINENFGSVKELPQGYDYVDVEFDTFKWRRISEKSRATKVKTGKKICRFAQFPDGHRAILPAILEELLKARADTRKRIKTEPDAFMKNILDKRQLAYKMTANSLYGQCGSKTSTFFEKDVAAATTATGRMMIIYAKRIIEEVYGDLIYDTKDNGPVCCKAEYVYGDSVANYTPIFIKHNNNISLYQIDQICEVFGDNKWIKCTENGKQDKEVCNFNGVETWSEKGWTPLHRVIRHPLASHKKMFRVLTHTGLVDVTDDHSLLRVDGTEISPKSATIGTELLHHNNPSFIQNNTTIKKEEAQIMGFFFGDGSCGNYNCPSGKKSSWALNNASVEIINKYLKLCEDVYSNFSWVIMDTLKSSNVYKLVPRSKKYGDITNFVKIYREKLYNNNKSKIIPNEILTANEEIRQSFWNGMYDADGDKTTGNIRIDQKNQISITYIYILANSLGWNISINARSDKLNIYRLNMTKKSQRKNPIKIKKIYEIPYPEGEYVYDLTTDNHHFAAGIGELIVHNTDSVFFTFNLQSLKGEPIRGKPALEITIEIAQDVAKLCSQYLKAPMELTYEKTLMPFILLSKKRYVGMLFENDAKGDGKLKFMGLSIKRRDSCDYLKEVYGGILSILMKEQNVVSAVKYLTDSLQQLIDGNVPLDKLIITRALRSDYKNPQQIAHRVLADRIGERDTGNKPKSGDRIKYLFIQPNVEPVKGKSVLMGDRVETPEYIMAGKAKIDYTHYITNQLMNPMTQLFGLALEQIHCGKKNTISQYNNTIAQLKTQFRDDLEGFNKQKDKYCSKEIEKIIFQPILNKIKNKNSNQTNLSQYLNR
jgi:DNA polymerase elongation subunit (family B)